MENWKCNAGKNFSRQTLNHDLQSFHLRWHLSGVSARFIGWFSAFTSKFCCLGRASNSCCSLSFSALAFCYVFSFGPQTPSAGKQAMYWVSFLLLDYPKLVSLFSIPWSLNFHGSTLILLVLVFSLKATFISCGPSGVASTERLLQLSAISFYEVFTDVINRFLYPPIGHSGSRLLCHFPSLNRNFYCLNSRAFNIRPIHSLGQETLVTYWRAFWRHCLKLWFTMLGCLFCQKYADSSKSWNIFATLPTTASQSCFAIIFLISAVGWNSLLNWLLRCCC